VCCRECRWWDYDISRDEKEVAFTQIWVASLDRSKPPRLIARAGDQVSFGADGDMVFRSLEAATNWLVRIKRDGSQRERITTVPVLEKRGVSPDGEWVIVGSPGPIYLLAVPIHGGAQRRVCASDCASAGWSSNGRVFYVESGESAVSGKSPGVTLAVPIPVGRSLPDLPLDLSAGGVTPRASQLIGHVSVSSGSDPAIYVFAKTDPQRNLFRIPLH
jgi:hypothetical protein